MIFLPILFKICLLALDVVGSSKHNDFSASTALTNALAYLDGLAKREVIDAAGSGCKRGTTMCCTYVFKKSYTNWGLPVEGMVVYSLRARVVGQKLLEFYCCEPSKAPWSNLEEPACAGPYQLSCSVGQYAALQDVLLPERDDFGVIVDFHTSAGFCLDWRGMTKDTIRADNTGCLDVPLIEEKLWIYAWYTLTTRPGKGTYPAFAVVWAELQIKGSKQVMGRHDKGFVLEWGPGIPGVDYEVCIQAAAADTLLHIRLGDEHEKH